MSENTTLLTVLVSTGILTALAQLIVAVAGYIKGKTDRAVIAGKVDAVASDVGAHTNQLTNLTAATNGLTKTLVATAAAEGDAAGFTRGVAQERAVAKDLLASNEKGNKS